MDLQYWEGDGIVSGVTDEIVTSLGDETGSVSSESDESENNPVTVTWLNPCRLSSGMAGMLIFIQYYVLSVQDLSF
jgi:hypothetical protein